MRLTILTATMALLVLFSGCSKSETDGPVGSDVSLTTTWDDRTDGVAIPSSYRVKVGDFETSLSGSSNPLNHEFTPGAYNLFVYNEAEKITINDGVATVSSVGSGTLESMPGWFFTAYHEFNVESGRQYDLNIPMRQQVRELKLVLIPSGDAASRIERITATLSGVGSKIDLKSGAVSVEAGVDVVFEKKTSGNYEAVMRILGVVGDAQKLLSTIEYTQGNPVNTVVENDLSTLLVGFNSNKKMPLALSADVTVASEAGFTATISDWEEIEYTFDPSHDPALDITPHFLDDAFRAYIFSQIPGKTETNGDRILYADVKGIKTMDISAKGISSLAGIEYLDALTVLNCSGNNLTTFDLSKNTALKELNCSDSELIMIDLSKNILLEKLNCAGNSLQSLSVINNEVLVELICDTNPGDISKIFFVFMPEFVTETTIPAGYPLDGATWQYPTVGGAEITLRYQFFTDITEKFTDPTFRKWLFDYFGKVEARGDRILKSDVTNIEDLFVSGIGIESLAGIEHFDNLKNLYCERNKITSLDLSKNIELIALDCSFNLLTSLALSANTSLQNLFCTDNKIASIDTRSNKNLVVLQCTNNDLTSINTSENLFLRSFYCDKNKITSLDLLTNTNLEVLNCEENLLPSLNVSANKKLVRLRCGTNKLTSLNVTNNTRLLRVSCENNKITSLDVSVCTILNYYMCYDNLLTSIDISKNKELLWVLCYNNPGADDAGTYKFKINTWVGFDEFAADTYFPNSGNDNPNSGKCGQWKYTPAGGAERVVTVSYVIV